MNIYYIRAAIEDKLGIRLELEEIRQLLLEEGLINQSQAKHIIFRGYSEFYDYFYKQDDNVIETKPEITKPVELTEIIRD